MNEKHYKEQLTAFIDHELSKDDLQIIAEHLMRCADCRMEHDHLKFGASAAGQLTRSDAPESVWLRVENAIDGMREPLSGGMLQSPLFSLKNLVPYAAAVCIVAGIVLVAYLTLFRPNTADVAKTNNPEHTQPQIAAPLTQDPAMPPGNSEQAVSSAATVTSSNAMDPGTDQAHPATAPTSWQIETLTGAPRVGAASSANNLAVGDFLETDAASRARISVANIGNVEIGPNSRVKFVGTNPAEHRLSLERGVLNAKISAPPRLFIVDTPSAVAVDLGCEYRLEVDKAGGGKLMVSKGFVALENGGRESVVPAGAMCITKRGRPPGTPFAADTSDIFRKALDRFDFAGGGSAAVQTMLDSRSFYDMVTLWHLLSRVEETDREKVYDALSKYVTPPAGVTRQGILDLDKKMLAAWRTEVERVWFE